MKTLLGMMIVAACCMSLNAHAATESNVDINDRPTTPNYQERAYYGSVTKHDSFTMDMTQRQKAGRPSDNNILPDARTRAHTHCTKGGNISTHSRIKY